MRSPPAEPLPPYAVVVSHDGCVNWDVDLPQAWGERHHCIEFIENHLPPRGGYEFEIQDLASGRLVSFAYTPAPRRIRLHMQDLSSKE